MPPDGSALAQSYPMNNPVRLIARLIVGEYVKQMIEIDKAIPLPKLRARRGARQLYPWDGMEVGDSFAVAGITRNAMRATANYHEAKRGWTIQIENEGDGVRVFRMA